MCVCVCVCWRKSEDDGENATNKINFARYSMGVGGVGIGGFIYYIILRDAYKLVEIYI